MNSNPEVTEVKEQPAAPTREEQAMQDARDLKIALKESKVLTNRLSKKGLARVYNAVTEFPLGDKTPKFQDNDEKALFYLTLQMNPVKNRLINYFQSKQVEIEDSLKKAEAANGLGGTEESEATD